MEDEGIVLPPLRRPDVDGATLRQTIEAHLAIERAHLLRDLMVHLLALTSIPVALLAAWRGAPAALRSIALAAWAMTLVGAIVAARSEWKYRRLRAALVGELRTPRTSAR
jgi:hypothetical protein